MRIPVLHLSHKISAALAATSLLMLCIASIAVYSLHDIEAALVNVTRNEYVKMRMAASIESEINRQSRLITPFIGLSTADERDADREQLATSQEHTRRLYADLNNRLNSADEQAAMATVSVSRKDYEDALRAFLALYASDHGEDQKAGALRHLRTQRLNYLGDIERFSGLEETRQNAASDSAESRTASAIRAVSAVSILALVCALACGWRLQRAVTLPINGVVAVARRIASGDLSGHIDVARGDEIGMLRLALRQMQVSLTRLIGNIRSESEFIVSGSMQIAGGSAELSARTAEQASRLEQTAGATKNLAATVNRNTVSANHAAGFTRDVSDAMALTTHAIADAVHTMADVSQQATRIQSVVDLMDDIAFQTNLLALNAAVEASRAGEQGRGFAALASEVRTLSQRSAHAAAEVKILIRKSADDIAAGHRHVSEAEQAAGHARERVMQATALMADIAADGRVQSAGIDQINDALHDLDGATRQNAALAEETSAAAGTLQDTAARLMDTVAAFKLPATGQFDVPGR